MPVSVNSSSSFSSSISPSISDDNSRVSLTISDTTSPIISDSSSSVTPSISDSVCVCALVCQSIDLIESSSVIPTICVILFALMIPCSSLHIWRRMCWSVFHHLGMDDDSFLFLSSYNSASRMSNLKYRIRNQCVILFECISLIIIIVIRSILKRE